MGLFSKKNKNSHEKIDDILSPNFMSTYTTYPTLGAMFAEMGYTVVTADQLGDIPRAELDEFVKNTTRYMSWADMKSAAERAEASV
ncbi:MAG: hypothetical protein LBV27_09805 [Oscillospiraceae bacterium]|jgi:hypothetical protein|nr:hypothetical protein [Oscillospiraceae bacterium]